VRAERMRGSDNERAVARWAEFEYLVDVVVGKRGERRHLAYSEALAAFTADAPGPAPADAKALARDRTVLSMAMSGYGPKVIADVVAGRLTIEVVEQSAKLRLVGHTDAEIARYLAAHVAARTAVPAPPAIRIDQAARERFDHAVVRHAQRQGVDPDLVRAVIKHESAWNAAARSHKGAIGLMQLMPETARLLGVDPVDPEQNIAGGVRYLADLRALFNGNLEAAIVGYIAGPTYAQKWLRGETVLDGEVRAYLNNVKASYARRSGWRKD
jgi:soluble lytic murein transglycosylase-like protein